jgi:RNA polymerase-binding transcription factor DksA
MIDRPSDKEQEYFMKLELERLAKLREEHRKKLEEQERQKRKELHFMHCPKCGDDLEVTRLGGVEVDVCPDCGGLFLDAGELDKILEEKTRGPFAKALGSLRSVFGS